MTKFHNDRVNFFGEHGYFLVPAFLEPTEVVGLRRICDMALDQARAQSRTKGHTTPSINLFADPDCFSSAPGALARLMGLVSSARVCALLEGLAHPGEGDLPRIEKADYYHEQTQHDWDGDWHRDSQFVEHDPERERALVSSTTSVHVRVALEPDSQLEIVPGSHRRWDEPRENQIRKGAKRALSAMPEAIRVALSPGDACLFHAWSIHRATYQRAPRRRTLDALYAFGRPPTRRIDAMSGH